MLVNRPVCVGQIYNPSMPGIISCSNLIKRFGNKPVLSNLSFSVARGDIFGILGNNGAGKSVLINILLGLLSPDEGRVSLLGLDRKTHHREINSRINFSFSYQSLQLQSSPRENLLTFARLYGVKGHDSKISYYTKLLGIEPLVKNIKKVSHLSSGERVKLSLCKALITTPEILLLDEPFVFLDPKSLDHIVKVIKTINKTRKTTVIYTSHKLNEIRNLCDFVLILKEGQLSYLGKIRSEKKLLSYY